MRKKFSWNLFAAFQVSVTLHVASSVFFFIYPQIILICGARNTNKIYLKNTTTTRVVSKDRTSNYHHVASVREFTFFFVVFIYIFIIFEFEKMQKSIFVVVTDKNASSTSWYQEYKN